MTNLEINAATRSIESLEDLKYQRDFIIENLELNGDNVKKVMVQMANIVSASNWAEMSEFTNTNDLIEMAANDVAKSSPHVTHNGEMHRESAMKNLPSSLR